MTHSAKYQGLYTGILALAGAATLIATASAQNPQLQEKLAEIKQSQAANSQKLAQYTWKEQETISIKGEVKDTKLFQVQMGPGGQQQKTEINDQKAQQSGGREGRVKQRAVQHVSDEYQQYGQQISALAKQYVPPDSQKMQQAFAQGNISLQPGEGSVSLVIKNYVKPNDSMTLVINSQTKALTSVNIASYLDDPKDAVTISVQFSQLPDGTNYASNILINGVSKHLTVNEQNMNYQKL